MVSPAREKAVRLAYYGDDFTGSTDALEALTLAGLRTVLFLDLPTREMLDQEFADIEAFGIAGTARALTPEQMEAELPDIFRFMAESGAAVCHYKTCSTFDSSPGIGSIGKAVELARRTFCAQRYVPLVVGVPALKRYTVFGQHFAAVHGIAHRLDRHPVMSRHPVTPMDEADLLRHLAAQTTARSALVDILEQGDSADALEEAVERKLEEHPEIILFDVLDQERLARVGGLMWKEAARGPLFAAGSSGVEYALSAYWQASGPASGEKAFSAGSAGGSVPHQAPQCTSGAESAGAAESAPVGAVDGTSAGLAEPVAPEAAEPILVVSGSCSSMTQMQIDYALASGFAGIRIDPGEWIDGSGSGAASSRIASEALRLLRKGTSVIVYSAKGPGDASIARTKSGLHAAGRNSRDTGTMIGEALGRICRAVMMGKRLLRRIAVAGGDTSGYVMKQLDICALEMTGQIAPGVPLCRTYSHNSPFAGLELALKGGQMGGEDFFVKVRKWAGITGVESYEPVPNHAECMSSADREGLKGGTILKTVVAVYTGQGLAEPMKRIYEEQLPGCRVVTIVDDSLIYDVVQAGGVTPAVTRRLIQYYQNGAEMGADVIFNTCSSVGEVADLARSMINVPIVKIDDAMTLEAAAKYERIGVLATLPTTLEPTKRLIRRQAELLGREVAIIDGLADGAYDALVSGEPERHDAILLDTARWVAGQADVLVLAQGSMARMEKELGAIGIPVLSSPLRGVLAVKKLLEVPKP